MFHRSAVLPTSTLLGELRYQLIVSIIVRKRRSSGTPRVEPQHYWSSQWRQVVLFSSRQNEPRRRRCSSIVATQSLENEPPHLTDKGTMCFLSNVSRQHGASPRDAILFVRTVVRRRHETVNKRLKQFKCLETTFRHNVSPRAMLPFHCCIDPSCDQPWKASFSCSRLS